MSRRKDQEAKGHIRPSGDGLYYFDAEALPNYDARAEMVVRCGACRYRLLIIASAVLSVTRPADDDARAADTDSQWFSPMVQINTDGLFGQTWPADQLFETFGEKGMIDGLECPKCGVNGIRFSWNRHRDRLLEAWRDAEKHREPRRIVVDC